MIFLVEIKRCQKKGLQASQADFSVSFRLGPSRAHGPSAGPAEANDLPETHGALHGPPKFHGPRGHCTPLPPLSVALNITAVLHDISH